MYKRGTANDTSLETPRALSVVTKLACYRVSTWVLCSQRKWWIFFSTTQDNYSHSRFREKANLYIKSLPQLTSVTSKQIIHVRICGRSKRQTTTTTTTSSSSSSSSSSSFCCCCSCNGNNNNNVSSSRRLKLLDCISKRSIHTYVDISLVLEVLKVQNSIFCAPFSASSAISLVIRSSISCT